MPFSRFVIKILDLEYCYNGLFSVWNSEYKVFLTLISEV